MRAAILLAALPVVELRRTVRSGFSGRLRGSGKVCRRCVPGGSDAHERATNISRSSVTTNAAILVPQCRPARSRSSRSEGYRPPKRRIRIGTQQFITLDLTMEIGAIAENVTVTGQSPIIETSNASQGTVLDSAALQSLPSPGRSAFMIGTTVPTVIPTGDTQFNRQQDQTNASLLSLGGGTRRGNSYTLDGVPITDMRNRAVANPTIEALEDMKVQVHTYDAEMGATGGGVFNTTLSRDEQFPWHGLLSDSPDLALEEQLLQRQGEPAQAQQPLLPGWIRVRRSDQKKPDILLGCGRRLHGRPDPECGRGDAHGARARRRFLEDDQRGRRARRHLRPADAAALPWQRHPGRPIIRVRSMLNYLPLPATTLHGNTNYNRTRDQIQVDQESTAGRAQVTARYVDRFLSNNRSTSRAPTIRTDDQTAPNRFADPND